MKKIYISGKISGEEPEAVKQKFAAAEARISGRGDIAISPLKKTTPWHAPWEEHMKEDIKAMLDCDEVYALSDWDQSRGAQIEIYIAQNLGIPVTFEA